MTESSSTFHDYLWKSVKDKLRTEVLANDPRLVAVPNLSYASYFDSFGVFVKSKSQRLLPSMLIDAHSYNVIGHISQVIDLKMTNLARLFDNCKPLNDENFGITQWECEVQVGHRSFHVIIDDMQKTTMPMFLRKGDIFLKKGIPDVTTLSTCVQSVYIITDVLKAGSITAVMIDNSDKMEKIHIGSRPIAFGYDKFSLDGPQWVIAGQEKTKPTHHGKWDVVVNRISDHLNHLP